MARAEIRERAAPVSVALHWAMLILIVAVYACIELRGYYHRGSDVREGLKMWHFMLGLLVLLLVLIRIALRLFGSTPPITPQTSALQTMVAKVTHLALYLFMLAMPIAGWMILSAEGAVVPFFGLELPWLVGVDKVLARQIEEVHETIGYFLIGLHALAALFHHHVMKDDTLRRMLPR